MPLEDTIDNEISNDIAEEEEIPEEEEEEEEEIPMEAGEGDSMETLMDSLLSEEIEEEALMEALDEMADDNDKREVADADGDGVPDWCNPVKPMGAWLNFKNMRVWCADRGFTDFGPYGGAPSAGNGLAEGDAAGAGGDEDAA